MKTWLRWSSPGPPSPARTACLPPRTREALHAYLKGVLTPSRRAAGTGAGREGEGLGLRHAAGRAAVAVVEGDEESFNLALADALEAHPRLLPGRQPRG
ncbi:hypothetical protein LV779_34785 [Streptomyces thinghirensis]|nr:hypothetical protein [Streptomyces thinghirensis]